MRVPEADAPQTRPIGELTPRLVGVKVAALYLGISAWSVREWIASGVIPRVAVALPRSAKRKGDTCRRVLVDVRDLDALIDRWKARGV
jgi:hypothetical protein